MHLIFAFKVRDMQKDKKTDGEEFWERMDILIGDSRPYSWAESLGIKKSGFQSARTRRAKPLPKTVEDWAQKIGCSFAWLNSGVGEPVVLPVEQKPSLSILTPKQREGVALISRLGSSTLLNDINKELLEQCFDVTDGALEATFSSMRADDKSDFIIKLYKTKLEEINQVFSLNEENFMLAIFTIEVALVYTRHTMTPKSKAQLIPDIYEKYHSNPAMKQATIKQLEKYRGENF